MTFLFFSCVSHRFGAFSLRFGGISVLKLFTLRQFKQNRIFAKSLRAEKREKCIKITGRCGKVTSRLWVMGPNH